jgi:outer membrane protein assembly factor BamB
MITHFLSATLCLWLFATSSFGANNSWPQFRGPDGTGKADNVDPPTTWSETTNVAWKTAIPGRGHSSPVIRDDRVWLTTAMETNTRKTQIEGQPRFVSDHITLKLISLDLKTGKIDKNITLFDLDKPDPTHVLNSYATPTPVVEAERIYCDFGTYGTACVDTKSGRILWKRRLVIDHHVGPGSSPAVYKNLLIVIRDGREVQYLAALDTTTGKTIWKTDRPPLAPVAKTDLKKSFSTPTFYHHAGEDRVTAPSAQWLTAYDPATGEEIWRANHGKGFSISAQPAVGNGMVYYCTGFGGNFLRAVRIDGKGDVTKSHVAWNSKRWVPTIPSPLLLDKELYWIADAGIACCADAVSGEIIWHKSLHGRFRASPIYAGGKLYFASTKGRCSVLEPGREFKLLATNDIAEAEVTASPAFIDRSIILRTHTHLYHIVNGTP